MAFYGRQGVLKKFLRIANPIAKRLGAIPSNFIYHAFAVNGAQLDSLKPIVIGCASFHSQRENGRSLQKLAERDAKR
jgi:hypothetical protein